MAKLAANGGRSRPISRYPIPIPARSCSGSRSPAVAALECPCWYGRPIRQAVKLKSGLTSWTMIGDDEGETRNDQSLIVLVVVSIVAAALGSHRHRAWRRGAAKMISSLLWGVIFVLVVSV